MKIQCVVLRVDGNIKKKCRLKQLFQSFLHQKFIFWLTQKSGYAMMNRYELTPVLSHLDTPTNDRGYGKYKIKGGNQHDFKGKESSNYRTVRQLSLIHI